MSSLVYSTADLLKLRNSQGISPVLRTQLALLGIRKKNRNCRSRHFYAKRKSFGQDPADRSTAYARRNITLPSIMLCNCRSIINKFTDFGLTLLSNNPDFVFVSETWLSNNVPDSCTEVASYHCFRKDRYSKPGGGVALYFKSHLHVTRRFDLEDDRIESIWAEYRFDNPVLGFGKGILCSLYHPPTADRRLLSEHLQHCLESVNNLSSMPLILIGGDFNRTTAPALHSLKQIVSKATRGDSILDCLYTNLDCVYSSDDVSILPPIGNSDHNTIIVKPINHVSHSMFEKRTVVVRHRTPSNIWSFGCYLSYLNWYHLLLFNDVQVVSDIFYYVFKLGFDAFVPIKTYKFCQHNKPWFNTKLKDIHFSKRKAFSSANGTFRGLSHIEWNNRFKVECSIAKREYLTKSCSSSKGFWRAASSIFGRSNSSNFSHTLASDAQTNFGTSDLAEAFSLLFQRKWSQQPSIPPSNVPFSAPQISISSAYYLLSNMPAKATCGPDGIPSWALNEFACLLAVPAALLFNLSLQSATLPSQWRIQMVSPVPKTSKPRQLKDYRPIAVSSSLGKSLEKFVTNSLLTFLGPNFDRTQFGFRRNSSCTVALISTIHQWLLDLEKGKDIHAVFLDFSAAFDSIPHSIILDKMSMLNVPCWIIAFTKAFLHKRLQLVNFDGSHSSKVFVKSGVPQGSIISPSLFAISVHDFPVSDQINVCKYADDTTIWSSTKKDKGCLKEFCRLIVDWCRENNLALNASKSAEMHISLGPHKLHEPLLINGEVVPTVRETRFLGVIIKDNLAWSSHVEVIISKASQALFLLRRFRSFGASSDQLLKVYNAYFLPCVEYCAPVWDGNISKTDSRRLESLNRRALRICDVPDMTILSTRRESQRLSLFMKALSDPSHLLHTFIPNPIKHGRTTRLSCSGALEVPRARLEKFRNSFFVKTTRDYNSNL